MDNRWDDEWNKTSRSYRRILESISKVDAHVHTYTSLFKSGVYNSMFVNTVVLKHYPFEYMHCWEFVELADTIAAWS
jgi:hypothetical protein